MSSTDVQSALDELASALPFVYDKNGNRIGVYYGPGFEVNYGYHWTVWDISQKVLFAVDKITGQIIIDLGGPLALFYTSSDCSGTPYLDIGPLYPIRVNNTIYRQASNGIPVSLSNIQSYIENGGTCSDIASLDAAALLKAAQAYIESEYTNPIFVEAQVISDPNYQGPLFIR